MVLASLFKGDPLFIGPGIKHGKGHDFVIRTLVEFELKVGLTPRNPKFLEGLISYIEILPFDSRCVSSAVDIYNKLKQKNQLVGLADIIIAATAISNNMQLLTLNTKHFKRIEKLKLISH